MDWNKIQKAYEAVQNDLAKRIDVTDKVLVYKAGGVIRIDIKQ
jgi:hypothetical protein